MKITQLREVLKSQGLGARKIDGSRYAITSNGDALFSLDIEKIRDEAQARERVQSELVFARQRNQEA